MQSIKVTLKGTLKMGNGDILSKGHVFRGPVGDLPEEIQKMVKKNSSVLLIQKEIVPEEKTIDPQELEKEAEAKEKAEAEAKEKAEAEKKELKRPARTTQKKG